MEENQTTEQEQKELEPLWTVNQVAQFLSVHPGTVRNWLCKKQVIRKEKVVKIGNRTRIPRSEVVRIAGVVQKGLKDKS